MNLTRIRGIEIVVKRLVSIFAVLLATEALADDGKWTPKQVLQLDQRALRAKGLKLPATRLWDAKRGTGLLAGAVNVTGCSGAFVSKEGLVVTNHHCVYSIVQEHTTPARDLLKNGFLAKTRDEELLGTGSRIQVPKKFTDVTKEVLAAVPPNADDLTRFRAIDAKQKELTLECEKQPATRCQVASFGGGLEYTLFEAIDVQDVRLVYAPPRAMGEFGGEIDNWSWPRHTNDFAIVRAYVGKDGKAAPASKDNIPLTPEFYFPISDKGVKPGDLVMVLGYPGLTVREMLAGEMETRADKFYPRVIDLYGEMIDILEAVNDAEGKIALASQLKSLMNRKKNAEGQIAGLARGKIVEKQRLDEETFLKNAPTEAIAARATLLDEHEKSKTTFEREMLLDAVSRSSRALYLASTVARLSTEREKVDLERDPQFMDRELARLRDRLDREQKNIFVPADQKLFVAWVKRALALGPAERIPAVDKHFGAKATEKDVVAKVAAMFAGTRTLNLEARRAMIGAKPSELRAKKDPLLDFGFEIAAELDALKLLSDRRAGTSLRLRPSWRSAVLARSKKVIAPDANGTLRVSFGSVKGYVPRDGIFYTPQTTLSGLLAKGTGKDPFDIPERVKTAAEAKKLGRWADPKLGDVPMCFLADADTTGGNSGSPVVDGEGRLVGVNFDRVWENVANDFGYNPDVARNISVDIRAMLWMLDQVEDAGALLAELGIKR